jgi:hypothetical protein
MGARRRTWLRLATTVVCLIVAGTAGAQESWGGAGGASTWGGKSATSGAGSLAHGAAASGGSANWVAGRANSGPMAAPGGVWTDTSGMPAAGGEAEGKTPAGKSAAPDGLGTTTGISHLKITSAASGGTHSAGVSSLPHVGAQHAAKGGLLPKAVAGRGLAASHYGGGSHSHSKINFVASDTNTPGAKKPGNSTKKPSSAFSGNPGGMGEPTDMAEPTGEPDINNLPKY